MEQKISEIKENTTETQRRPLLSKRMFQMLLDENSDNFPEAIEQMTELIRVHYS